VILAVASGKGGVGKSTIAYNLGAILDAVVIDADLGMANLPTGPGPDLHDVLAGRADPQEAIRTGPVTLVPCGRSLAGARAADVTALADVVDDVHREFPHVVVDCPAGLRADAGVPLAVADAALLVVSPRAFALADAVRTRELARELDAGVVAVALNRVVDEPPVEAIERTLGAPVTVVPADPRLGATIERGEPVTAAATAGTGATAIRELADAVRACDRT
jgi:septum site-determining protein MinD